MIKTLSEHYYPSNKTCYEVSEEAASERRASWKDGPWCSGSATVRHADWWEVYTATLQGAAPDVLLPNGAGGQGVHLFAKAPDGTIAHIGCAYPDLRNPGALLLV